MVVGLLDQDALLYPHSFRPNLEVMKLSTFYKNKKEIVRLVMDARTTDQYSKVFLRKNKIDNSYPDTLLCKPNIAFGGLAFTDNKYKPLSEEIENCLPDISIYDKLIPNLKMGRIQKADFKGSHLRLSTDGKTCNVDYDKFLFNGNAIIHDNNLFDLEGSYDALLDISKKYLIMTRYGPQMKKNEIEKWLNNIRFYKNSTKFVVKDNLSNYEFKQLVEMSYLLNFNFGTLPIKNEVALLDEIEQTVRRILYLKAYQYNNTLVYDKTSIFNYLGYKKYFAPLEGWSEGRTMSLNSFLGVRQKKEFEYIEKKRPILKSLFAADPLLIRQKGGVILT